MMGWAVPCRPGWRVDWAALLAQFPVVARLAGLSQSARYHSEGDVLKHTRLVCEMVAVSPKWRSYSEKERAIVFIAALLHDIGKLQSVPDDTNHPLTSRDHARRGARIARRLLYEQGVPFRMREAIVNLIRYHQVPFWVFENENPATLVQRISLNIRCDWLATLAEADAKGRISDERAPLQEAVGLYREMALSLDCLECPAEFGSPHGRFLYFQGQWHMPDFIPPESFRCRAILVSGLPGAGKYRWISETCSTLPLVRKTGMTDEKQQAREYLEAGRTFVWRTADVSRIPRRKMAALAAEYDARVEIVYVENTYGRLVEHHRRSRVAGSKPCLHDCLDNHWDVPDPWEADALCRVVD